jgi:hypothetical protein
MKKSVLFFIVFTIVAGGCASGMRTHKDDILYNICQANHLFELYHHAKLDYTFHVQLPDKTVVREWQWWIKSGKIRLNGNDQTVSQPFVNDLYWLLFPLKAYEDRDQTQVTVSRNRPSPLSGTPATEVTIRYVGGKGFTPNDTYKLYVDKNLIIREWSYLKASKEPPARTTTWDDYRTIGGMYLSLQRQGPDGFTVWFSGVKVE